MKLVSHIRMPYGGMYYWRDPLTGVEVKGTHFEMLLNNAYDQRRANGAPIGTEFAQEIERDICATYPDECDNVPPGVRRKAFWSMGEIVGGTLVMIQNRLQGTQFVSQEEANRRAAICANCPRAVFFSKPCTGLCRELVNVLAGTGDKRTPFDHDLRACGVCGCWLKVSVWFPLDVQCIGVDETMRKDFATVNNCWKQCTQ